MKKTFNSHNLLIYGLPLALILSLVLLVKSSFYAQDADNLSIGITLDLLVTLPALYFILIRKTEIPKITVLSVFIIGLIIASFLLPEGQQHLLTQIKHYVLPLVELGIATFVIIKARKTIIQFKAQEDSSLDFYDAIKQACQESLPGRVGSLLATEISVIYYVFFGKSKTTLAENEYTYHKKSGIITAVYMLLGMAMIEMIAVHILVHNSYPTLAWVLTFFSAYACIQIISLIRSIGSRPTKIDFDKQILHLKYGFFSETNIPFETIESIELNKRSLPTDNSVAEFSPLGLLDTHNIIIHLKEENIIQRIYGIKNKYRSLAIYIDKKETFVAQIKMLTSKPEKTDDLN